MGRSVPSLATRTVWFASPTMPPSANTFWAGFSTVSRVRSLTMRKTSSSGRPAASSCVQPVRATATGLREVTRPSVSVVVTASPMLASVTRNDSRCRSARSRLWCIASANQLITTPATRNIPIRARSAAWVICQPSPSMKKYVPAARLRAIASRPGFSPPAHAAAITANRKR
jgi:hypothetical protein